MAPLEANPPASASETLLERARRGDREALDRIARQELPSVRRLLRRLLGPRQDLDDLVQTVFVEFCTGFTKYRAGSSSLSAFVRGYARMIALRAMQPAAWERRRCALDFEPTCCGLDPEESAVAREHVRRLRRAITQLSGPKREALLLWAVEGKTPDEISRLTSASVPAIRSRIFFAQKELRNAAVHDPYLSEMLAA